MFTCSSCGYEANPDSAVACSLCGTKKAGADGGSSAKGSGAKASEPKKRPASEDDLAAVAQAVADSADAGTTPTKTGSKGSKGGATRDAHTGVIRLDKGPPPLANAVTAVGVLLGAIAGYVFAAMKWGHAPGSLGELVPMVLAAVALGAGMRLLLTESFESSLSPSARETFAGPVSMLVGLGFVVFSIVGFVLGARPTGPGAAVVGSAARAVGRPGEVLAEHLVLLTQWSARAKTDKVFIVTRGGKDVRIPLAPLTAEDLESIQVATGLAPAELERLAADEPIAPAQRLDPIEWSVDGFLEKLNYFYGIRKNDRGPKTSGKIALVRVKPGGGEELFSLPEPAGVANDLRTAVPANTKLWVAYSLGFKHESSPAHDPLAEQILEKYKGE